MISIIIPVYNSEDSIRKLIEEIIKSLKNNYSFEILLINDSSQDNTHQICVELTNDYNFINYLELSNNFGEHNAVMAGLNNCVGDYAVIMDDDFQNSSDSLLKLINYGLENKNEFDVVYTKYKNKKDGFFRNAGSKFNDLIANIILKKSKDLYLSSFKLINRFLIDQINIHKSPYVYIDGVIHQITNKISYVEVEHETRKKGKSGYTITKLIQLWLRMFTGFSILPLRISSIIGVIITFFGIILGFITFFERIFNNSIPSGYASLIIVSIIFSGSILIALGLIGEYIGRIFLTINKKPQYVIKNQIKKKN
tara:strand:- start:15 stop:944 length:930 start_codon:yes stop_codon:yes gene_type:complete